MNSVTTKRENKVWFHHSWDIIPPLIEIKDGILTQYRTLGIGKEDTPFNKQLLSNKQQEVNDSIALAKINWSAYQAESIHSMRFNPK